MGMFGLGGKKTSAKSEVEGGQGSKSKRPPVKPGAGKTVRVVAQPKQPTATAAIQVSKPTPPAPKPEARTEGRDAAVSSTGAMGPQTVTRPIPTQGGGSLVRARSEKGPCRSGDPALTEFLVQKTKLLTSEQAEQAAALAQQEVLSLDEAVVKLQLLTEELLVNALTQECYVPHLKLDKYDIRKKALEVLTKDDTLYYGVFPVDKLGSLLTLAMVNPLDQETIATLEAKTGLDVKRVVATRAEILQAIDKYYGGKVEAKDHSISFSADPHTETRSMSQVIGKVPVQDLDLDAPLPPPPAPAKSKVPRPPSVVMPSTAAQRSEKATTVSAPAKPKSEPLAPAAKTGPIAPEPPLEIQDIDDLLASDDIIAPAILEPLRIDGDPITVPASDVIDLLDASPAPALEVKSDRMKRESTRLKAMDFVQDDDGAQDAPILPGTQRLGSPAKGHEPSGEMKKTAGARPTLINLQPVHEDEFKHAISHGKGHVFEKWVGLQSRNRIINAVVVEPQVQALLAGHLGGRAA